MFPTFAHATVPSGCSHPASPEAKCIPSCTGTPHPHSGKIVPWQSPQACMFRCPNSFAGSGPYMNLIQVISIGSRASLLFAGVREDRHGACGKILWGFNNSSPNPVLPWEICNYLPNRHVLSLKHPFALDAKTWNAYQPTFPCKEPACLAAENGPTAAMIRRNTA